MGAAFVGLAFLVCGLGFLYLIGPDHAAAKERKQIHQYDMARRAEERREDVFLSTVMQEVIKMLAEDGLVPFLDTDRRAEFSRLVLEYNKQRKA